VHKGLQENTSLVSLLQQARILWLCKFWRSYWHHVHPVTTRRRSLAKMKEVLHPFGVFFVGDVDFTCENNCYADEDVIFRYISMRLS